MMPVLPFLGFSPFSVPLPFFLSVFPFRLSCSGSFLPGAAGDVPFLKFKSFRLIPIPFFSLPFLSFFLSLYLPEAGIGVRASKKRS